jgi:DNA-binding transcriptional LysR family regulator
MIYVSNAYLNGPRGNLTVNVHLQQLVYLREVARRGSISAAAESLHVSQPALSQALSELARRLDVPLLQRSGRNRRPTAAGAEVVRFAEETLAGADALLHRLDALRRGEGGTLGVGMIDAASLYVLPQVVRRYREDHPAVDLKLTVGTSNTLLQRLRAFELDLAFVVGPVAEADLSSKEVLSEALHVYAPAAAAGDRKKARWVLYPEGSRTRRIIDEAFARRGLRPDVVLESDNPAVLRQMVAFGLGWSVLPPAIAEEEAAPAGVLRAERLAERHLYAALRRETNRDARAEAFLALALTRAAG